MGSTKEEQDRVRNLLLDTVTLLCKNGLNFKQQLKVQGLLGITLDDDSVFIVHINEQVGEAVPEKKDVEESSDQSSIDSRRSSRDSQTTPYKNRKRTADTSPVFRGPPEKIKVKMEKEDTDEDLILLHDENDIDDKSHLKAQMLHQQQANVPSVTNIHSGFSQFNPQNNMHQPGGPFISGVSGTHTMTPLTPGGTPEKYPAWYTGFDYQATRKSARRDRQSGEKPFMCDFPNCGRRYFNKRHMLRHQTVQHGRPKCKGSTKFSHAETFPVNMMTNINAALQHGQNMENLLTPQGPLGSTKSALFGSYPISIGTDFSLTAQHVQSLGGLDMQGTASEFSNGSVMSTEDKSLVLNNDTNQELDDSGQNEDTILLHNDPLDQTENLGVTENLNDNELHQSHNRALLLKNELDITSKTTTGNVETEEPSKKKECDDLDNSDILDYSIPSDLLCRSKISTNSENNFS